MRPRLLKYLRVNDEPPTSWDDLAQKLPVEIDNLTRWFDFCGDLAHQRLWEYELLTIDFNFKSDPSGPWFPLPGQDPKVYNADFLTDPALAQLRWSDCLNDIGPNSGLLIGAHLISHAAYRDLPCGVAFHTYFPNMVIRDMCSAMIATQMLLASGAHIPTGNLRETMRAAIELVEQSSKKPFDGLVDAVVRFQQAFIQRAGADSSLDKGVARLWMEPTSLWTLLDIFRSAQTDDELEDRLQKFGIEFYDRNGALHSLNIRSMFLDRLIYKDQVGVNHVRSRLPLAEVKPAGDTQPESGVIWRFIETLAMNTPSNISPVLEFFDNLKAGNNTRTINEAVKRKVHRLIALVFAWLDLYAERWFDTQSRSWDPFDDELNSALPALTEQIGELLRIIELTGEEGWPADLLPGEAREQYFDPRVHFLPLSDRGPFSISAMLREHCVPESVLFRALRYDRSDSAISQSRTAALAHLLDIAVQWGCIEEGLNPQGEGTQRYRLKHLEIPQRRPMRMVQVDLARHLGFEVKGDDDASTQLKRIIQGTPGFERVSVKDFLNGLEERPLPEHLKWLGWEFMDRFWGPPNIRSLPYDAWPVCLSEIGGRFLRQSA
jgi:hypothetical protein